MIHIKITNGKTKAVLADFQLIATPGGYDGLWAASSFLCEHIQDAAKRLTSYVVKHIL